MDDGALDDRPLTFDDLAGALATRLQAASPISASAPSTRSSSSASASHEPVPYPDAEGRGGIQALLEGLMRFGWSGVYEDGPDGQTLIALQRGGANVSLEPGGQFELSGAPLETMHDICEETGQHLRRGRDGRRASSASASWAWASRPIWTRDDSRRSCPRAATRSCAPTCPRSAALGPRHDVPHLHGAGQPRLRLRGRHGRPSSAVSLALQPIATALFANSPFIEGKPTGCLSSRAHVWTDTDPDRTGMLHFVFEDGFGFETYARYALDVPMYFVKRDGRYIDVSGRSFRDFMAGELPELPGERPTFKDWADHLTTIFPEVRLKKYLEMRGADTGPRSRLCALPALWIGLLYDTAALAAAWDLCKDWTAEERERAARRRRARLGLKAEVAGRTVRDVANDMLAIAREGLKRRARLGASLVDETGYLGELDEIAETGMTPAERLLDLYNGPWRGDVTPVFEAAAY